MKVSPLRGCKGGSVATLWQTSDSSLAVMSLISLCLRITSLTGQCMVNREGGTTYARLRSILYVPAIVKVECVPEFSFVQEEAMLFTIGKTISQEEDPFSFARAIFLFLSVERTLSSSLARQTSLRRFEFLIFLLAFSIRSMGTEPFRF